jgi:hypothetical protein
LVKQTNGHLHHWLITWLYAWLTPQLMTAVLMFNQDVQAQVGSRLVGNGRAASRKDQS